MSHKQDRAMALLEVTEAIVTLERTVAALERAKAYLRDSERLRAAKAEPTSTPHANKKADSGR